MSRLPLIDLCGAAEVVTAGSATIVDLRWTNKHCLLIHYPVRLPGRQRKGTGWASAGRLPTMRRWIALVGLLLPACTGGGMTDYPLAVQVADLRFAQPGLLEQSIGIDLRFTNPNPEPIRADGLRFVLELEGRSFGTGVSDASFEIPRLGEVVVPVTMRVQTGALIERLVGFDGSDIHYRITGDLFQPTGLGAATARRVPFASEAAIAVPDLRSLLGAGQGS
jgi:LEA14-like dessication related protein